MKRFKFFQSDNGAPPPATTIPVVTPGNEAVTDHTIDHAAKIATLDGRVTQQESDFYRRLSETEEQLRHAIEEGGNGTRERITELENKIAAMTSAPPPAPEPQGVPFEVPSPEPSPVPPEKMARGIRARRNKRRTK